jgi:hypothetical protein
MRLACARIELLGGLDYYPRVGSTTLRTRRRPRHATARGQPGPGARGTIEDDPARGHRITTMSIEAAALIFALLWGPTLVWLIFRAVSGPGSRRPDSFADGHAPGQSSSLGPEALLLEYWVCKDCRSVNHQGANHCYSCGHDRAPVEHVPPVRPLTPDPLLSGNSWVPVMDAAPDQHATQHTAATVRRMSNGHTLNPVDPVLAPEPVPAAAVAAKAARATKRPRSARRGGATPATAIADASVAAHTAGAAPVLIAAADVETAPRTRRQAPASAPPVCPYLGFKDDPATRCDYPDTRNVCHAAAASAASSRLSARRLVRGGGAMPISPDHQVSLCLTTTHQQCERYPDAAAAEGSA